MQAHPQVVELFYGSIDKFWVIGEDSGLKIAAEGAFHADSGPGEVRRADVGGFQVKDHHLEVDSRAHDAFQVGHKNRIAVEIFAEVRAGLLGVYQTHTHTALQEACELPQQGNRITILLNVHILDISGTNPQRIADLRDTRNDFGVMLFVGYVLGEGGHVQKHTKKVAPIKGRLI